MVKTIKVTQRDIYLGEAESVFHCPVARAVRRAFRAKADRIVVVHPEVGEGGVYVGGAELGEKRAWTGKPSKAMVRFILAFDRGRKVTPRSFDIEFK